MRPHVRLHTRHRSVLIKLLRISVISFVLNTSCNNQYTGITPYEVRSVWWPISATWFRQVLRDFGDSDPYFHPCGPLLRPWCSTSNPVQWHELWDHRIEAFDTLFSKKKREALDIQSAHLLRWWIEDWSRSSDRVTVKSVSRMIRTVDPCIGRPRSLAMGELCRLYCALGILGQGFCTFDVNVTFASNKGRSLHNDLNLGRPLSRKAKLALSQLIG